MNEPMAVIPRASPGLQRAFRLLRIIYKFDCWCRGFIAAPVVPVLDDLIANLKNCFEEGERLFPELKENNPNCQYRIAFGIIKCSLKSVEFCPYCFGVYCVLHSEHGEKENHLGHSS